MRTIVNLFAVKARIKLNPKKLYQADSEAVTEILKIASILYKVKHTLLRLPTPKLLKKKKQLPSHFLPKLPTSKHINFKLTKFVTSVQDFMML